MNKLLTTEQTAAILNVSRHALRSWRRSGRGPIYVKVGRLVRYDPDDLRTWMEARRQGSGKRH